MIVGMKQLHKAGDPTLGWDDSVWDEIQKLRILLAKDTSEKVSIFTKIRKAVAEGEFALASSMQVEMQEKIEELKKLYHEGHSPIFLFQAHPGHAFGRLPSLLLPPVSYDQSRTDEKYCARLKKRIPEAANVHIPQTGPSRDRQK